MSLRKFQKIFGTKKCSVIGMVHARALPGTPNYDGDFNGILEQARHEAHLYTNNAIDAILIENMHDVPYVQDKKIGWEIVSAMTRLSVEIKKIAKNVPCGIQILAGGNKQALAVAKTADLQFIRAEGFVFSHIADEGWMDACAGDILRYRKRIDAENVLIFTDLKKKHSSHAVTSDVSLIETCHAAEFFLTDGIILTGTATGCPVNVDDLKSIQDKTNAPILMGSGVTRDNLQDYFSQSHAVIVGSYFKNDGLWNGQLSEARIQQFMEKIKELREY